jgi:hypothetical protein
MLSDQQSLPLQVRLGLAKQMVRLALMEPFSLFHTARPEK